jgi:hypothetical protein
MAFLDKAQKCSFDGVEFPIISIEVVGGLRDHIHEFPHADGGAPEKLGRKLYVIRIRAIFDEGIQTQYNGGTPTYPDALGLLRDVFERGLSRDLVLPNLGTIKTYCRSWPQRLDVAVRSGETADFEFVEDPQVSNAGVFVLEAVPAATAMFIQLDHFNQEGDLQQQRMDAAIASLVPGGSLDLTQASRVDPSALSGLAAAFTTIIKLRDEESLYGQLLEATVASVLRYAELVTNAITSPFDVSLLYAVLDIVSSTQKFEKNALNTVAPIKKYTTVRYMSVVDISKAIFGDSAHATDILTMNPIEDAFRVPPGTTISYIDSSTSVGSMSLGNPPPFTS